ncbi:hypothetical protein C2845_PM01G05280 [Panicum miliaceum]|uniref:Uncharacterized protein n=1 Tax=Panicum miliaceum TaxID=4540 RepID=A0A3L6TQQ3_PANMI|nr:hypothetical protein C2845_PM01G05280 [Panicum miliaceum]
MDADGACSVRMQQTCTPDKKRRRVQFTDGEVNQQHLNNAGIQIQAAKGDVKRSHLKFQEKATSSHQAFLLYTREVLVRECVKLAGAVRRAAAGCVTPSTGDDEDNLPYMQLDKVTHAVSRETFGPLYLVT